MATPINEAELKTKCEEATKYGEKKTCLYLDFFLCYHATGFVDDKGFGLKFRRQY